MTGKQSGKSDIEKVYDHFAQGYDAGRDAFFVEIGGETFLWVTVGKTAAGDAA